MLNVSFSAASLTLTQDEGAFLFSLRPARSFSCARMSADFARAAQRSAVQANADVDADADVDAGGGGRARALNVRRVSEREMPVWGLTRSLCS